MIPESGVPIGISDHTVGWHVPLAAVALGAQAIEKHLTFDKADPRSLDNPGALEPQEFPEMVRQVILRNNISCQGKISRRNGARYGDGPGGGTDGPFPEEFNLAWR